jgi:plasmid stabilization system protein ParE
MAIVYWTPEALHRLREIESFISAQSSRTARNVVAKILQRTRQLIAAPHSGRQIPEYRDHDLRELLERPYRIIYRGL